MEENTIFYIFIIPYNDKKVKYRLNDGKETYSMSIEKMYDFILKYISSRHKSMVSEYLWSFIPFLIDVEDDQILDLVEDPSLKKNERKKIGKKMREEQELRDIANFSNTKKTLSFNSNVTPYWKK